MARPEPQSRRFKVEDIAIEVTIIKPNHNFLFFI
jgi:hypothetical protein